MIIIPEMTRPKLMQHSRRVGAIEYQILCGVCYKAKLNIYDNLSRIKHVLK